LRGGLCVDAITHLRKAAADDSLTEERSRFDPAPIAVRLIAIVERDYTARGVAGKSALGRRDESVVEDRLAPDDCLRSQSFACFVARLVGL
jgi:hypothetical protein